MDKPVATMTMIDTDSLRAFGQSMLSAPLGCLRAENLEDINRNCKLAANEIDDLRQLVKDLCALDIKENANGTAEGVLQRAYPVIAAQKQPGAHRP